MAHHHGPTCPESIQDVIDAWKADHEDSHTQWACATEEFVRDNSHLHGPEIEQKDRNFILVIITVLIVFGVLFERGVLAWAKRVATGALRPIVDALLAEVCMLGVLGMTLYITVHKTDILNNVSEKWYDNPNHLIHLLEDVHFAMFAVIVVLLVQALYMVWYAKKRAHQWEKANLLAQEEPEVLVQRYVEAQKSGYNRLFGSEESEQLQFAALRRRFVYTPAGVKRDVPEDFEFNEYLSAIMGETVGETVEIPISVWFMLELTVIGVWAMYYSNDHSFHVQDCILYLVGLTFAFCCIMHLAYGKMGEIESALVAPYFYNMADNMAAHAESNDESSKLTGGKKSHYDAKEGDDSELPPYLAPGSLCKPGVGPSKLVANLCCVHQHPMGKHLSLFPFGPEGPEFFLRLCQLSMVYSAMYFGFFLCQIRRVWDLTEKPHGAHGAHGEEAGDEGRRLMDRWTGNLRRMLQEHGAAHGHGHGHSSEFWIDTPMESIVVTALIMAAPMYMLWMLPKMLQRLVNISSVEELKHHHVITECRREAGTKKAIRAMKLLRCMKSSFKKNSKVKDPNVKHAVIDRQSSVIQAKRDEVKEMFNIFDKSGDGDIDKDELDGLLKLMNMGSSAGSTTEILHQIDTDGSGVIDFEEFFDWYLDNLYSPDDGDEDIESYVKDMFQMLLGDKNQTQIQYAPFADAMSQIGGGIPPDDVRAIFNEIDDDKSGEISLGELTEFIKRHADGL